MNYCLTLVRGAKKGYYNLDHENVTDNKTFWKYIQPFLLKKAQLIIKLHWSSRT